MKERVSVTSALGRSGSLEIGWGLLLVGRLTGERDEPERDARDDSLQPKLIHE
jgi:hypothetical protein